LSALCLAAGTEGHVECGEKALAESALSCARRECESGTTRPRDLGNGFLFLQAREVGGGGSRPLVVDSGRCARNCGWPRKKLVIDSGPAASRKPQRSVWPVKLGENPSSRRPFPIVWWFNPDMSCREIADLGAVQGREMAGGRRTDLGRSQTAEPASRKQRGVV